MRIRRIGIPGHGFITWEGGVDFLRLIIGSLLAGPDASRTELYLLLPVADPRLEQVETRSWPKRLRMMAMREELPELPDPPHNLGLDKIQNSLEEFWPLLKPRRVGHEPASLVRAYKALKLDALIPAMSPVTEDPSVNWVGYIYDMQHKHFPHFFSEQEIIQRDIHFREMLSQRRAIIVNSANVKADLETYVKDIQGTVYPMPFSASPNPKWFVDTQDVRPLYGVGDNYFCVCNQFWKHKDHATVFKAFAIIAGDEPSLELVCTGHQSDYRDPQYFEYLTKLISQLGLTSKVRLTGSIPKAHQISLLKGARALLQPTLFEGGPGGGAVFDAVSLGLPSVVSDIPVNLELQEPTVTFFKAGDEHSLATELRRLLSQPNRPIHLDEAALVAQGQHRRTRCAYTLQQAMARGKRNV